MDALTLFLPYILFWVLFKLWWNLSGKNQKPEKRAKDPIKGEIWLQIMTAGLLILLLLGFYATESSMIRDPLVRITGNVVLVLGLGFATWAKLRMGANWSMPVEKVKGRKLVTTGPFRYIRHPIYTGIWLGIVGTALATNWHVLAFALVGGIHFVVYARIEEKTLTREFPKEYPAYHAKTKMFVPFIW